MASDTWEKKPKSFELGEAGCCGALSSQEMPKHCLTCSGNGWVVAMRVVLQSTWGWCAGGQAGRKLHPGISWRGAEPGEGDSSAHR